MTVHYQRSFLQYILFYKITYELYFLIVWTKLLILFLIIKKIITFVHDNLAYLNSIWWA